MRNTRKTRKSRNTSKNPRKTNRNERSTSRNIRPSRNTRHTRHTQNSKPPTDRSTRDDLKKKRKEVGDLQVQIENLIMQVFQKKEEGAEIMAIRSQLILCQNRLRDNEEEARKNGGLSIDLVSTKEA